MGFTVTMKAAGISGDIRLISTLDSVAVGKSRTAVVAFIDATVAKYFSEW